jgi:hypothetical protein
VDRTWAPWWRASARAIAHVAFLREPNAERRDAYLERALEFVDKLEERPRVAVAHEKLED